MTADRLPRRYTLESGRASLPWEPPLPIRPGESLRVRLLARAVSPVAEPLGEWEFGPLDVPPQFIEVDLWRLDFYSVQLQTTGGVRLARRFVGDPNGRPSGRLGLDVAKAVGGISFPAFSAELVMRAEDLRDATERFERSRVPPIQWFFVELTNRCNFECAWCPKPQMRRRPGAMPLARARQLLDQIACYRRTHPLFSLYAELGHPVFLHVMGEPLLHPDWEEIVAYGRQQGVDFCLVTNASLLRGDTVGRLLDNGIAAVVLSLNAPDAAAFEATGAKLAYDRLVQQVQDFIAERYRRGLAMPRIELQLLNSTGVEIPGCRLVDDNAQVQAQLAFWSRFARGLEREFGSVGPAADGDVAQRWPTVLDRHQVNDPDTYFTVGHNFSLAFKQTCNFANALLPAGASVREAHRGRCPFGNTHRVLCVFWDGSCSFCSLDYDNEVNLGNVFEEGIEGIWAGPRMRRIRALMDHDVPIETLCRRCLGEVAGTGAAGYVHRTGNRHD